MSTVVLAAGKGRRLWPLTENRPKPMLPVGNRPILEYVIDALKNAGVKEVILVVGSNRERVQNHFENGDEYGISISYAVQDQQLGTGHAVLQAASHISGSFLVVNGDQIIETELVEDVWREHQRSSAPVMSVTRAEDPSRYGVVEFDDDHKTVVRIQEKPIPELVASELVNAGVYAFTPDIFAAIRETEMYGEQALTETLSRYAADRRLTAVTHTEQVLDVSEPWDLLRVNAAATSGGREVPESATVAPSAVVADNAVLGDGVTVHPQAAVLSGAVLGDNVSVGPGVLLDDTVIFPDVTLHSGAVLTDCIIGANTTVGGNTTVDGGVTDVVLNGTVYQDVTFGGLLGDNVTVGGNVTMQPGTIVGNNATLGSGTLVSGRVDDSQHVTRG